MRKHMWLLSAGLFALSVPAYAQDAPQTDTDQGAAQPTEGATAEGAAVDNQAVEQQPVDTGDIVVTATRRNEALSDVPLAVSAVTAETLENSGISDIRQLTQVSPSLLVSSTQSEAGAGVARIRGIGTVGDNPGLESSVGVFIDGVYRSRTGVGLTELGQLDRIEVLRGPQGTLFGRNTSAGLISVITAKPRFETSLYGQLDLGNHSLRRIELGGTGALSETVAMRLDGVYVKRDGFMEDVISGREINDRDRYMVRGQMLYQPSENFSVRLVADRASRNEECCGAAYLPFADVVGDGDGGYTRTDSTIAGILTGLGATISDDTFEREQSITPGRTYRSDVNDWGLSGEIVYDFGGAELTSITAYRHNKFVRGQDADFNDLDILARDDDGGSYNRFNTFSQELRLQGSAFGDKLDWLVGAYYAKESLRSRDNLQYGADYSRFANCLIALNFQQNFAPLLSAPLVDTTNPTCFNTAQTGLLIASPFTSATNDQILAAFGRLGVFAAPIFNNSGFSNAATAFGAPGLTLDNVGIDDLWKQRSNNFALFTHNIFSITDRLKFTAGLRWTRETKKLDATLTDNNTMCTFISTGVGGALSGLQNLPCVIPSVPGGFLEGDSKKTESRFSGTAVLSYKPMDNLLAYLSYSRGYKAGGFNLDRSALPRPFVVTSIGPAPGPVSAGADFDTLQFKPETNEAVELGFKYNGRGIDVNVAFFRQLFRNFQLNTFNGIQFIVENVNSCKEDLDGTDTDNDPYTVTGECDGSTQAGVRSRGVELEVFSRPMRDVNLNFGLTYADTKYRKNLVGADGRALPFVLFQLPGRRVSNAPALTLTGSFAYTPRLTQGLRGLFYIDARRSSDYNTGSDLDFDKIQDSYAVVNARIGIRDEDDAWGLELWAQNLFDKDYKQVAFDAFAQGLCNTRGAAQGYCLPASALNPGNAFRATQLYASFLAEPRTFGVTLRGKFGPRRAAAPAYVAPPAPPPPPAPEPVVEQPAPPPPPPPPPAEGERG